MIFQAIPAKFGDSLLLTFPQAAGGVRRMLVDGGPPGVFAAAVKPVLKALAPAGGGAVVLDAVMVSHIDDDHIVGVIALFDEIKAAKTNATPRPYRVDNLIYNSFDALTDGRAATLAPAGNVIASLGGAIAPPGLDEHAKAVLASYPHGSQLAQTARAVQVPINGSLVATPPLVAGDPAVMVGSAKLTIVGPLQGELDDLREAWDKWQATKTPHATAALAAYVDKSVPNLSSIVALVESGARKVLLTGDARGDKTLKGLELAGKLPAGGHIDVDILKLPHHGSVRDVDHDYFERIRAQHYVASGDGTYGNPDRATLEMIHTARQAVAPGVIYDLYLTYAAAHIDATHKAYRAAHGKGFDPHVDGIADLIATFKASGKVRVHEGPVTINLP